MERIQRIDGIKYNLDQLSDEELRNIQGHLLGRHAVLTADIGVVEEELFARSHQQLPLEDLPEEAMGDRPELGFNYETFIRTVHGD